MHEILMKTALIVPQSWRIYDCLNIRGMFEQRRELPTIILCALYSRIWVRGKNVAHWIFISLLFNGRSVCITSEDTGWVNSAYQGVSASSVLIDSDSELPNCDRFNEEYAGWPESKACFKTRVNAHSHVKSHHFFLEAATWVCLMGVTALRGQLLVQNMQKLWMTEPPPRA